MQTGNPRFFSNVKYPYGSQGRYMYGLYWFNNTQKEVYLEFYKNDDVIKSVVSHLEKHVLNGETSIEIEKNAANYELKQNSFKLWNTFFKKAFHMINIFGMVPWFVRKENELFIPDVPELWSGNFGAI